MKLNIVLPWICVLGLGAGLGALYVSNAAKEKDLASLRDEIQKAQATHDELEQVKGQAKSREDEIARLRLDQQELLRLRAEVGKLRDDKAQLDKKMLQAQTEAQRAQAQVQAAQAGAQQVQDENARLRNATAAAQNQQNAQRIGCINYLRALDNAKQTWALQHNQAANAVPTSQDIAPYFNNTLPGCPAGGSYTLNAVGQETTCSLPGHVIPK